MGVSSTSATEVGSGVGVSATISRTAIVGTGWTGAAPLCWLPEGIGGRTGGSGVWVGMEVAVGGTGVTVGGSGVGSGVGVGSGLPPKQATASMDSEMAMMSAMRAMRNSPILKVGLLWALLGPTALWKDSGTWVPL